MARKTNSLVIVRDMSPEQFCDLLCEMMSRLSETHGGEIRSLVNTTLPTCKCGVCQHLLMRPVEGEPLITFHAATNQFYCASCAEKRNVVDRDCFAFDECATDHVDDIRQVCESFFGKKRWGKLVETTHRDRTKLIRRGRGHRSFATH